MAAVNYLDKYAENIGKRQADQVLRYLDEKRKTGAIRTVDEFVSQLQDLLQELTSTTLSPTLNVYEAEEEEVIDSETYNHMLDRIRDDFQSSFEEANNIDKVQQSHRAIMKDMVLKNIRRAINQLEAKVRLYENKREQDGAVDHSIETTFNEVGRNRSRRDQVLESDIIFADPRTGKEITNNAVIEEAGDRLTLSKGTDEEYKIKKVRQVFDSSFPQSALKVELPGTTISNIIDQTQYTYWIQSLLFESIQSYAKVKLELTLPTEKDINYIEIEPITDRGMILESIEYEDSALSIQTISSTEVTFTTPIRINFSRLPAKKIYLTFRNENGVETDFKYNSADTSLSFQAIERTEEDGSDYINSIYSDLDDILSSATVKDIIGIIPGNKKEFSGYSYTFGIDNIRTGLSLYDNQAIFISAPIEIKKEVGHLYLEANETRPVALSPNSIPSNTSTTYDGTDTNFYFSSIEYFVIKRDFGINLSTGQEYVIKTLKLPLIPFNKTRINHERLLLTDKSVSTSVKNDIGSTLLFTDRIAGNVKIYRNGELTTYGSDWTDFTSTTNKTPNSGNKMEFKIKIENPFVGDIYTVSYTPMKSTTRGIPKTLSAFTGSGVDVVDMAGDLSARYVGSNDIFLNRKNTKVAYSKIFLGIILRNNSARNALSAAVEDVKLFIGIKKGNR